MAFIAASQGKIIESFFTWTDYQAYAQMTNGTANPDITATLDFDESTNASLIADMRSNLGAYTLPLINGVAQLQKNGQAVTVAPDSTIYDIGKAILPACNEAALESIFVPLAQGTATSLQTQQLLAYIALKLRGAGII